MSIKKNSIYSPSNAVSSSPVRLVNFDINTLAIFSLNIFLAISLALFFSPSSMPYILPSYLSAHYLSYASPKSPSKLTSSASFKYLFITFHHPNLLVSPSPYLLVQECIFLFHLDFFHLQYTIFFLSSVHMFV